MRGPGNGPDRGVVLRCDGEGRIVDVLRDDLGLVDRDDASLAEAVAPGSRVKARNFFEALAEEDGALGWDLLVEVDGEARELYFAGGRTADGTFLVIGAGSEQGATGLYEELMRISNDQANLLRTVSRDRFAGARVESEAPGRSGDAADPVEALSRVNNELTNLQRELARKNAELERLNDEKDRFLGMAAHDLRNPLGVIRACSEFLLEGGFSEGDPREQQFLEKIHSSSRFMLRLVEELLDISKIESGAIDLALEPLDLSEVVRRNADLNRVLAEEKDIEIEVELPDEPLEGRWDEPKLEQVLNNLISNAVKYSAPGTRVRVRARARGDAVELAVEDEGQGIPEKEQDRLFKPFSSTSVKATGGERSTGLGLAITKKIVDAHGGTIEVESEPGEGSTFSVTLPVAPGAVA